MTVATTGETSLSRPERDLLEAVGDSPCLHLSSAPGVFEAACKVVGGRPEEIENVERVTEGVIVRVAGRPSIEVDGSVDPIPATMATSYIVVADDFPDAMGRVGLLPLAIPAQGRPSILGSPYRKPLQDDGPPDPSETIQTVTDRIRSLQSRLAEIPEELDRTITEEAIERLENERTAIQRRVVVLQRRLAILQREFVRASEREHERRQEIANEAIRQLHVRAKPIWVKILGLAGELDALKAEAVHQGADKVDVSVSDPSFASLNRIAHQHNRLVDVQPARPRTPKSRLRRSRKDAK